MPRRASRGTGPSRDPIGTDHTPWPGSPHPASSRSAAIHPVVAARSMSATGRSHRMVSPASTTRGSGVRTPGPRPPRLEPHEHAVALDEPFLVHDVQGGRLRVEPVELGPHPRAQPGLVGALGQRVRVQLDDGAARLACHRAAWSSNRSSTETLSSGP